MGDDRVVTAIVVGCGNRGENYSNFALDFKERLKIVGVVDPLVHRRNKLAKWHQIPEENVFSDWTELENKVKLADIAFVCTQDKDHCAPAVMLAAQGYHILLEKPMAVTEEDCQRIAKACEENGVMLAVCHVMRYFPPCVKIKEIIDSGEIGEVMTINHTENIGYWHFAHSFVRGNWRNEAESTFSLMAKCCHDMDLIYYWMGGRSVKTIQSVGSLQHFKKENKPAGASDRCLDCKLADSCPYSATRLYLKEPITKQWPRSVVCDIEDDPRKYPAALKETLKTSRYGSCVYECDNDVCDSQMVNMMFEGGAIANLTMTAFTKLCTRHTRITGSLGEITWQGSEDGPIVLHNFRTDQTKLVRPDMVAPDCATRGHGGADFFLIESVIKAVTTGDPNLIKSGAKESLASHMLVFQAEKSRLENTK